MSNASQTPSTSRIAVVLGGGGVTGAWFELGALRALDALLGTRRTHQMDVFVGVSCGAVVGAHLAAGLEPHVLVEALSAKGRSGLEAPFEPRRILRPNWRELGARLARAPRGMAQAAWLLASGQGPHGVKDTLAALGEFLPSGILDGDGLEASVRHNLEATTCRDQWSLLRRELYVVAVDVDTHERTVFGGAGSQDVPISRAVRASSSFPPAYAPTRIHGRDYVDGGVDRNFYLDVAVAAGAQLILCVNPLLPLLNTPGAATVRKLDGNTGRISDKGLPGVLDQTVRLILSGRMTGSVEELKRSYPDVDVLMVEPTPHDYGMFLYNVGRFSARTATARLGYLAAYGALSQQAERWRPVFDRHGLTFDLACVGREAALLQQGHHRKDIMAVLAQPPHLRPNA